jgi:hypothetical protein
MLTASEFRFSAAANTGAKQPNPRSFGIGQSRLGAPGGNNLR